MTSLALAKDLSTLNEYLSWETWKERWISAKDVWACKGLLHFGFSAASGLEQVAECATLYLELAEGNQAFKTARGTEKWRTGAVSIEAYETLGRRFFGTTNGPKSPLALPPCVLEKIFHFFRLDDLGRFVNVQLHTGSEADSAAITFIVKLCRQIWKTRPNDEHCNADTLPVVLAKRAEVLPILYACGPGELFALIESMFRVVPAWELFDEKSVQMLERMADWTQRKQKGGSALINGSVPAYVLTLVKTVQAELARKAKVPVGPIED